MQESPGFAIPDNWDAERIQEALLASTEDLVALKDASLRYRAVSDSFCRAVGRKRSEILGHTDDEIYGGEVANRYRQEDLKILSSGQAVHSDSRGREDLDRYFSVVKTPVRGFSGEVSGVLMVIREITVRKIHEMEQEMLVEKLSRALAEIKTLHGILPICSCCKKIRDDSGYWERIEAYIEQNSQALFSHSLCPDCVSKMGQSGMDTAQA